MNEAFSQSYQLPTVAPSPNPATHLTTVLLEQAEIELITFSLTNYRPTTAVTNLREIKTNLWLLALIPIPSPPQ